jgi:sialidase-1
VKTNLTGHLLSRTAFLVGVSLCGLPSGAAEPQLVDVFVGGRDGYNAYRIPSLIATSKGTLLAFCEGRKFNILDQSPTNMMLRRSLDGGRTWQPLQVVVPAVPEAAMNPTPVIDHGTGMILLVYDLWPEYIKDKWPEHYTRAPGLGRNSITTWITASSDDGATWSTPLDITAMTKKPEWTQTVHGPGVGIQTRTGRLVIPCCECKADGVDWNFAIFSDDHGKTWRMSDNEVGPGVNESQVVELADGTLVLNMRSDSSKGCRIGAVSKDDGRTWSAAFDIPALPDPGCQGSILRYTWADERGGKSRILFCNPGTTQSRDRGTIRVSYDEGKTWPVAKMIVKESFGYSCVTALPDGTIGCLFEAAECCKISFRRFSLTWLTDGSDSIP